MSNQPKQAAESQTETVRSPRQDGGECEEEGNVIIWVTCSGRPVKKRRYEVHIIDSMDIVDDTAVVQKPPHNPNILGIGLPFVVSPGLVPVTPPSPPPLCSS